MAGLGVWVLLLLRWGGGRRVDWGEGNVGGVAGLLLRCL